MWHLYISIFFKFTQSRASDDQSVKVRPSAKLIPTPLTTTDVWRRHTSIPTDGLSVQRLLATDSQLVYRGCGIVFGSSRTINFTAFFHGNIHLNMLEHVDITQQHHFEE